MNMGAAKAAPAVAMKRLLVKLYGRLIV
jgi:hypothetical protein